MDSANETKPAFDGLLSVVVPCRDEEEMLPIFRNEFFRTMAEMGNPRFEIIFVEDGSKDRTLEILREMSRADARIRFISFSRNFGKEAAMFAGLKAAKGDFITIMDADLQDPPSLLPQMFDAMLNGGFDSVAARATASRPCARTAQKSSTKYSTASRRLNSPRARATTA